MYARPTGSFRMRRLCAFVLPVCLLTCACDSGGDGKGEEFEPGGCGLAGYSWLPKEQVGAIISHAEVAGVTSEDMDLQLIMAGMEALTPVPYGTRVFKLRYTTQDKGQPVEATGLVALPWNDGATGESHSTMLYLHGGIGMAHECVHGDWGLLMEMLAQLWATMGFVTLLPDYIGLDRDADPDNPPTTRHPFLVMEATAISALDMLRATERLLAEDLSDLVTTDDKLAMAGVSQGGHAVFSCDLFTPFYAPEFTFDAALASVPGVDLVSSMRLGMSETNDTTGMIAMLFTTQHLWYEGEDSMDDLLVSGEPWKAREKATELLESGCVEDMVVSFREIPVISDVFRSDVRDALMSGRWDEAEPWSCYLLDNSPLHTTRVSRARETPMLFQISEHDEYIPAENMRENLGTLCDDGYRLDFLECAGVEHTKGALDSLPEQVDWLADRLSGNPIPAGDLCRVKPPVTCTGDSSF